MNPPALRATPSQESNGDWDTTTCPNFPGNLPPPGRRPRSHATLASFLAAFLLLLTSPPAASAAPAVVSLSFEGNAAIPTARLRHALEHNLDYLLATQQTAPQAPLDHLIPTLLLAGYQQAGFLEARVTITTNHPGPDLLVSISEGPRYRCGILVIEGARTAPVDALLNHLSQNLDHPTNDPLTYDADPTPSHHSSAHPPRPSLSPLAHTLRHALETNATFTTPSPPSPTHPIRPSAPPAWSTNRWIAGDRIALARYAHAATNAFYQLGFPTPKLHLSTRPNPLTRTCDLVVHVIDEGPAAILDSLDVTGLKRTSKDDLLRLLDFRPGAFITPALLERFRERLELSARFTRCQWNLSPPATDGKSILRLAVVEVESAPPLAEELSAMDLAFLRLRTWLDRFEEQESDLILQITADHASPRLRLEARFILSPSGAFLIAVDRTNPDLDRPDPVAAAMLGARQWAWFAPPYRLKAGGPLPPTQLSFDLTLAAKGVATNKASLAFGFSFQRSPDPDASLLRFVAQLEPAAFVEFARDPRLTLAREPAPAPPPNLQLTPQITANHSVILVTLDGHQLRFDESTGRLLEFTTRNLVDDPERSNLKDTGPESITCQLTTRTNALLEELNRLGAATASHRLLATNHPLQSVGTLLAEAIQRHPHLLGALAERLTPTSTTTEFRPTPLLSLLHTLDRATSSPERLTTAAAALAKYCQAIPSSAPANPSPLPPGTPDDETFSIPWPAASPQKTPPNPWTGVAAWILSPAQHFVPQGAWPHHLLVAAALHLVGQPGPASAELEAAFQDERTGPIGFLFIAHTLAQAGHPAARAFAFQGTMRLLPTDFRSDYEMLLSKGSLLTDALNEAFWNLRSLSPVEIQSLANLLPPADAAFLRAAWLGVQPPGPATLTQRLAPALDQWWRDALRDRVRTCLRSWKP